MAYSASLFSQMLAILPQTLLAQAVQKHRANRYTKIFSAWDHLVAMLFCQMGQAKSLREICGGLASCLGKLSHLGVKNIPKRSTLSYANEHRSHAFFRDIFYTLLQYAQTLGQGRKKFRFKNKLYSIDASLIPLCLSLCDWAHYRQKKGAAKLHLVLDHDGYLPAFALITEGKVHDVRPAHRLCFEPGTIVAMDRGYNDYSLFGQWSDQGVSFITRLKSNADYEVVEERELPDKRPHIWRDVIIRFTSKAGSEAGDHLYRVVMVFDEKKGEMIELLTNHLGFGATTIAAIYKDRWQIELFFKALKQNLKVKTFVGTSANAVQIQIWTALIAILLFKILQFKSRMSWSLSNLVALLRFNLFTYRDLWEWINDPFRKPIQPPDVQLTFEQIYFGQQKGGLE